MKIHNLFPLTILNDTIEISNKERQKLIDLVLSMHKKSTPRHNPHSAWTGDVHGHEFIFNQKGFEKLGKKITSIIREFLAVLSINNNLVDIYFQRSWATITKKAQNIKPHTHSQSNISFAYYLLKPKNSGGIIFQSKDTQNAISKNIFGIDKMDKGLIKEVNAYNTNEITIDLKQDSIVVFPSKSLHSTAPNTSGEKRISLSGDITLMLKSSFGYEHLMPNFVHWKKFD